MAAFSIVFRPPENQQAGIQLIGWSPKLLVDPLGQQSGGKNHMKEGIKTDILARCRLKDAQAMAYE